VIDDRARLLAAFIGADAVGLWLWVSYGRRRGGDGDGRVRRPRIGLHDDPQQVLRDSDASP
jgi:hypothetical protein